MTTKPIMGRSITIPLTLEQERRLDRHVPNKNKGKNYVPEFYRSIIDVYLASAAFLELEAKDQVFQLEHKLKRLTAEKDTEIQSLKIQLKLANAKTAAR